MAVVLMLLPVGACGQVSAGAEDTGDRAREVSPTMTAATLATSPTDRGTVVVDGNGRTLYMFTADLAGSKSSCHDACVTEWPPLDAPAAHAGKGVASMSIGTIERPHGTEQITYHEHPLYYFAGDDHVGDTEGQGVTSFGGTWFMLRPDGTPVRP
jgi:predicted lipoprotein with Yx(FWY)xxD motif